MIDPLQIKEKFPIFSSLTPKGKSLTYLDNAASTQKPQVVIDSIQEFYSGYNSNIHRGAYWPASQSSGAYEEARSIVAKFINSEPQNVIFTSGTTDSINRVANSWLLPVLSEDDNVIVTQMDHHSNMIPWQQTCFKKGAELRVCPLTTDLRLDLQALEALISEGTKLIAVSTVSNTLGVQNDIGRIVELAKRYDVKVLVDAAQSIAHDRTDIKALDCDFLVFSGHKIYGPTGIGILCGKEERLEEMLPDRMGGGGIKNVRFEETIFADSPAKFEAGTPNIAGAIGLGTAIRFVEEVGMDDIHTHTSRLAISFIEELEQIPEITHFSHFDSKLQGPVVSFTVKDIHPHDIAGFLNEDGIAIRAGHHCTQPLMELLNVPGTCRVSFGVYNNENDVKKVCDSLRKTIQFFQ